MVELTSEFPGSRRQNPGLTGEDVDFGSTPVLFQPPGCPQLMAAKNKSGVLLTYKVGHVSNGPLQRLQVADINDWEFNGLVAWSDVTHMLYVSNSSDSSSGPTRHGMVAFSVDANCKLNLAWQKTVGPNLNLVSPPTIAGGRGLLRRWIREPGPRIRCG